MTANELRENNNQLEKIERNKMKITKEKLEEMGACRDGLNWFNETFPRGIGIKTAAKAAR